MREPSVSNPVLSAVEVVNFIKYFIQMKHIYLIFLFLGIISCKQESTEKITDPKDYNAYLSTKNKESYDLALSENKFWGNRMAADSSGVGELGPLAGSFSLLFDATGNVNYLKDAEQLDRKAIEISAFSKDTYTRALAHNYISQHRFKEARTLLEKIFAGPTNKEATGRMLFDVYMELGEYEKADEMLGLIKDNSDYNYLIRLAKWSDHKGDLDAAIKYLEKARAIAESRGNRSLKIWTYSNLGDFYGHAGRLQNSYAEYLKTLELQPDNAYVKRQLAWLAYSHEHNTKEAQRILDSVMVNRKVPDYHLVKADMANYEGNIQERDKEWATFIKLINENPNYGNMYNTYLIEIYAEIDPEKALQLAEKEITNRATPETYQLLAYAQLVNGKKMDALKTIQEHVEGKTSEPKALYHAAMVYEANGMNDKVKELKKELSSAYYELGPNKAKKIKKF